MCCESSASPHAFNSLRRPRSLRVRAWSRIDRLLGRPTHFQVPSAQANPPQDYLVLVMRAPRPCPTMKGESEVGSGTTWSAHRADCIRTCARSSCRHGRGGHLWHVLSSPADGVKARAELRAALADEIPIDAETWTGFASQMCIRRRYRIRRYLRSSGPCGRTSEADLSRLPVRASEEGRCRARIAYKIRTAVCLEC
jgi:hypothetical protein